MMIVSPTVGRSLWKGPSSAGDGFGDGGDIARPANRSAGGLQLMDIL